MQGAHQRDGVEVRHDQRAGHQTGCAAGEQRADEAEHLVAFVADLDAGVAGGEHDAVRGDAAGGQLVDGERTVAQHERREHRVVRAQLSVAGQMRQPGAMQDTGHRRNSAVRRQEHVGSRVQLGQRRDLCNGAWQPGSGQQHHRVAGSLAAGRAGPEIGRWRHGGRGGVQRRPRQVGQLGAGDDDQRYVRADAEWADHQVGQAGQRRLGADPGRHRPTHRPRPGQPSEREQQLLRLRRHVGGVAQVHQPGASRFEDGGGQPAVQRAEHDEDLAAQRGPQLRRLRPAAGRVLRQLAGPGHPADPVLGSRDPGQQLGRLPPGVPAYLLELGLRRPQRSHLGRDPAGGRRIDGDERSRSGAVHPVQHPGRRPGRQDGPQAQLPELGPVSGREGAQLHRGQRCPVPAEVGETGAAVPQDGRGVAGCLRGERGRDPTPEPHQHRRPTGQPLGRSEALPGLGGAVLRQRQPTGREVSLDGVRAQPEALERVGRELDPAQGGQRHRPAQGQRLDHRDVGPGDPSEPALPAKAAGRRPCRRERLVGQAGGQREPGGPQLGFRRHQPAVMMAELRGGPAGRDPGLGQQPQVDQRIGVLGVVLSERQAGLLVQQAGFLELTQALGEPADLHADPGPALRNHRHEGRPEPGRQRHCPVDVHDRGRPVAELYLDQGQVVVRFHQHVQRAPGAPERVAVERGGVREAPDVLVQGGLLQDHLGGPVGADQRGGPVEVVLRGAEPSQLVGDRGATDEDLAEPAVEVVARGDPDGLVEQALGPVVVEADVFGPRQRPQPDDERLAGADGPGLCDHASRQVEVGLRVDQHALIGGLRLAQETDGSAVRAGRRHLSPVPAAAASIAQRCTRLACICPADGG